MYDSKNQERQSSYTISQLVDELRRMVESDGIPDDTPVMLATQPSWPFENTISGVVAVDMNSQNGDDDTSADLADNDGEPSYVVYLAEGSQVGYLPGNARSDLGWSRR